MSIVEGGVGEAGGGYGGDVGRHHLCTESSNYEDPLCVQWIVWASAMGDFHKVIPCYQVDKTLRRRHSQ